MSQYADYQQPTRGSGVNRWLIVAVVVLLGVLVAQYWDFRSEPLHDPNAEPRVVTPAGDLASDEKATIEIFQRAKPAVVHIKTTGYVRGFSLNPIEVPRGTGSGFIWDDKGHVVTNFHVIQRASRAEITLADRTTTDAEFVGGDADSDLVVLKIRLRRGKLTPIKDVGSSSDLQVGQKVFAIGNPFDFDYTLTTGIISGLNREIQAVSGRMIRDMIQTDAAINPGNSGGPLLDSSGRLIGVNTAIYSPSGASAGIGFAVPVDTINRVVPQLIANGRVERPVLGINPRDVSSDDVQGVLVYQVDPASGAAEAGLRSYEDHRDEADVIVAIEGQETPNVQKLRDVLEKHKIGATVKVTLLRNGSKHEVPVRLQSIIQKAEK